jgi:hypothetical protein
LRELQKKTLAEQKAFEKLPKSCFNYDYFEALVEGLRPASHSTVFYHVVFLMRRIILIGSAMWLNDVPFLQLLLFLTNTFGAMYFIVGANPFETTFENNLELFNETIVLTICVHEIFILQGDFTAK